MAMKLSVQNLSVSRGGQPLLADVSFDVSSGQALILRGPNGLGKTTLLRTIAGLQPPRVGAVDAPEARLVYAAHSDGIKSTLSVRENLSFWADIFGQTNIDQALDDFDLHDLIDRAAGTLSAGQKRRLGLARLSVTGRTIWILDEPTVSLDKWSVDRFANVIRRHLANGGIAVIATHIDLGLEEGATVLDLEQFKAHEDHSPKSDEAFL